MDVPGAVALVSGANRGFGESLCRALIARGAGKVYAGARNPASVTTPGVEPIQLDITSADDIAAAVRRCGDVTLLINNAGIGTGTAALAPDAITNARLEFETNTLGTLAMSQGFAPVLAANGGGAIVNVLSVLSWLHMPWSAAYCASKAASWALTNSLRQELQPQHTHVLALHVGLMDTDMTAGLDLPKSSPDDVAMHVIDGLEAGAFEELADDTSRAVRAALSGELTSLYPSLAS